MVRRAIDDPSVVGVRSVCDRHGTEAPSPWVCRWTPLLPEGARVLDLACGRGRHLRWLSGRGLHLSGVDRDPAALEQARASLGDSAAEWVVADLESGPWPFAGREFDALVVTNYLWRPLFPTLIACLAPGGVLLYETFASGHETVGRPARAEFLLQTGELLTQCASLRIVAYEDGFLDGPARFVQRIAAVRRKPSAPTAAPARYPLAQ